VHDRLVDAYRFDLPESVGVDGHQPAAGRAGDDDHRHLLLDLLHSRLDLLRLLHHLHDVTQTHLLDLQVSRVEKYRAERNEGTSQVTRYSISSRSSAVMAASS